MLDQIPSKLTITVFFVVIGDAVYAELNKKVEKYIEIYTRLNGKKALTKYFLATKMIVNPAKGSLILRKDLSVSYIIEGINGILGIANHTSSST